jgi:FkbM family methyltransferase
MNYTGFFGDGRFSEYVVANVIKSYMTPEDVLFDGGANEGFHTLRALATGAQVYAFEPIPELASKLREKAASEAMRPGQCEVIEAALSSTPGIASFTYCPGRSTLSGLIARARLSELQTEEITVQVTTIDEVIRHQGLPTPTVVKLDLEGGEFNAMQGARHTLSASPVLLFEHGGNEGSKLYGYTHDQYWEYMHGFGYTILHITGRDCTKEDFRKPKHWNFLALKLEQPRHRDLLDRLDYLVVDAGQKMALLHGVKTAV